MSAFAQRLPSAGPEREALREKGQFWTPEWVAGAMVAYVLARGAHHVFDPAVGGGVFLRAAKDFSKEQGKGILLLGTELDPGVLNEARQVGLQDDLENVEIREFILDPPRGPFEAIVANPPYIRHHRLPADYKEGLRAFSRQIFGRSLDGRAGIHIYFLIRALLLLAKNGRLAFIMPADTCEGVFADRLWKWITTSYRLEAVVTFAREASPFPNVDTNPLIFLIRNDEPCERISWATCTEVGGSHLKDWMRSDLKETPDRGLCIVGRQISEALSTGLSRTPCQSQLDTPLLGDFADVMRGIATGANEFFFLTRKDAAILKIPEEYFVSAIGRTRDINGDMVTPQTVTELEKRGRPSLLFSPGSKEFDLLPESVQRYLERGEKMGLPNRPLIATRRPWYKMEVRRIPAILFAYLGRRSARFVRNYAGVVPLTGFLCVFPKCTDPQFLERLWLTLKHPKTLENLRLVGKSYGAGAIKVEPRALERLPIPWEVVREAGLQGFMEHKQLKLPHTS